MKIGIISSNLIEKSHHSAAILGIIEFLGENNLYLDRVDFEFSCQICCICFPVTLFMFRA
jgi:hypothetical protein